MVSTIHVIKWYSWYFILLVRKGISVYDRQFICVPYITLPTSFEVADLSCYRSHNFGRSLFIMIIGRNPSPQVWLGYNVTGRKKFRYEAHLFRRIKKKLVVFVALFNSKVKIGHLFISYESRSFSVSGSTYVTLLKKVVRPHFLYRVTEERLWWMHAVSEPRCANKADSFW